MLFVDNEDEMVVMTGTSFVHQGSLWSGSDRCKEIMSLAYLLININIIISFIRTIFDCIYYLVPMYST